MTGLIDIKNSTLWDQLNKVFEIDIVYGDYEHYSTYSKGDKAIIYVPRNNINSASFTHELLHILIDSKQIYLGSGLYLDIKTKQNIARILSDNLIYHIGNTLEHTKMLPDFLALGYKIEDFLSDYHIDKFTSAEAERIKTNFYRWKLFKKVYNKSTIDFFIGKFFSAKACPNKFFDYSKQLKVLMDTDPQLYQICETIFNRWEEFDCDNPGVGSYHFLSIDFADNLEKWTVGKKINY